MGLAATKIQGRKMVDEANYFVDEVAPFSRESNLESNYYFFNEANYAIFRF